MEKSTENEALQKQELQELEDRLKREAEEANIDHETVSIELKMELREVANDLEIMMGVVERSIPEKPWLFDKKSPLGRAIRDAQITHDRLSKAEDTLWAALERL